MTPTPERSAPRRLRRARPLLPRAARRWTAVVAGALAVGAAGALVHEATGPTASTASSRPAATATGAGAASAAQAPSSPSAPPGAGTSGTGGTKGTSRWTAAVQSSAGSGVRTSTSGSAQAAAEPLPVGDLPGWRQVFADGFDTDVPEGSFTSSAYGARWHAYDGFPDTFKVGAYSDDVLSVSDGALQMRWRTQGGVPLVSGIVPLVDGRWGGHVGGRYSVRFRSEAPSSGYNAVFLLWPDANAWDQGEVDFAEGALDGGVRAYHHCPGHPEVPCASAETTAGWGQWHVATVEWTSTAVTYSLDGVQLLRSSDVPVDPLHLVLQGYVRPGWDATRDAVVQVDWVSVWYPDGS